MVIPTVFGFLPSFFPKSLLKVCDAGSYGNPNSFWVFAKLFSKKLINVVKPDLSWRNLTSLENPNKPLPK